MPSAAIFTLPLSSPLSPCYLLANKLSSHQILPLILFCCRKVKPPGIKKKHIKSIQGVCTCQKLAVLKLKVNPLDYHHFHQSKNNFFQYFGVDGKNKLNQ